jgi:hypothetical protein
MLLKTFRLPHPSRARMMSILMHETSSCYKEGVGSRFCMRKGSGWEAHLRRGHCRVVVGELEAVVDEGEREEARHSSRQEAVVAAQEQHVAVAPVGLHDELRAHAKIGSGACLGCMNEIISSTLLTMMTLHLSSPEGGWNDVIFLPSFRVTSCYSGLQG